MRLSLTVCTFQIHSYLCRRCIALFFIRYCQHNIRMVYLDDHGEMMEWIPVGRYSYVYFSFERLPEDEQLLGIPLIKKNLGIADWVNAMLGRCIPRTKTVCWVKERELSGCLPHIHYPILFSVRAVRSGGLFSLWRNSTIYCRRLSIKRLELKIRDAIKRSWSTLQLGHLIEMMLHGGCLCIFLIALRLLI